MERIYGLISDIAERHYIAACHPGISGVGIEHHRALYGRSGYGLLTRKVQQSEASSLPLLLYLHG